MVFFPEFVLSLTSVLCTLLLAPSTNLQANIGDNNISSNKKKTTKNNQIRYIYISPTSENKKEGEPSSNVQCPKPYKDIYTHTCKVAIINEIGQYLS